MLKIATKTRLSPEEAIKRAIKFFGPDGYKLEVKEQADNCACFEGVVVELRWSPAPRKRGPP